MSPGYPKKIDRVALGDNLSRVALFTCAKQTQQEIRRCSYILSLTSKKNLMWRLSEVWGVSLSNKQRSSLSPKPTFFLS
jgi:hypothetical protein